MIFFNIDGVKFLILTFHYQNTDLSNLKIWPHFFNHTLQFLKKKIIRLDKDTNRYYFYREILGIWVYTINKQADLIAPPPKLPLGHHLPFIRIIFYQEI